MSPAVSLLAGLASDLAAIVLLAYAGHPSFRAGPVWWSQHRHPIGGRAT
jgi:hypothetical protein